MSDETYTVTVRLTEKEAAALYSSVTGDIESLSEADWDSGLFWDLKSAQEKVLNARIEAKTIHLIDKRKGMGE